MAGKRRKRTDQEQGVMLVVETVGKKDRPGRGKMVAVRINHPETNPNLLYVLWSEQLVNGPRGRHLRAGDSVRAGVGREGVRQMLEVAHGNTRRLRETDLYPCEFVEEGSE